MLYVIDSKTLVGSYLKVCPPRAKTFGYQVTIVLVVTDQNMELPGKKTFRNQEATIWLPKTKTFACQGYKHLTVWDRSISLLETGIFNYQKQDYITAN